jgi:ribosomal protein S18 acetylase RimI-like enzyme
MSVREANADVRAATAGDSEAIREVARRSLQASYSMSPDTIDSAVEQWYADDAMEPLLDDDRRLFLVADHEGDVAGFADAVAPEGSDAGDLLWLHVNPDYRGEGIARTLLDETRDALEHRGVEELRGMVLSDNSEGNSFYQHHGFRKVDEREIDIDGRCHVENIYREGEVSGVDESAAAPWSDVGDDVIEATTDDGETVYADPTETDSGSKAPFLAVYADEGHERLWGYYCANCESLATAMDSMGRIECSDCWNARKPSRWDASYM